MSLQACLTAYGKLKIATKQWSDKIKIKNKKQKWENVWN